MMFHDGRLSLGDQYENGFNSPAEEWLVKGLNNLLAAQAVLPLVGESEMAGNSGENQVAGAIYDRIDMGWPILAKRVRVIPEYAKLFVATYEDVTDYSQVSISHIANAIGDFINFEWRSYDSPFDFYLNGDDQALSPNQKRGMKLFYGKAQCAECHQGVFFTDQKFYALALPQFGPGRTRVFDPYVRDVGRMAETDRLEDAYRFRTPGLRNVALTGPYGHNGAYATLEGIIRHHLDPLGSLANWDPAQVILPKAEWLNGIDFVVFEDRFERERLKSRLDIQPLDLTKAEVADLVIFMHALTGTESIWGRLGHPDKVPSGLPVD
jgi:cytochrome c peroxidase